ncbi:hypothetical protein M1N66_03935 [Thermodesulfovibrionales bacterium]|nr:hypothetical protein [Thermodesulfovibrionales bacterium]
MEFLLIIVGIILLIVLYFIFGVFLKFIWGWLPLMVGIISGIIIGFLGGWIGAIFGLILVVSSIGLTNSWQDSSLYLKFEDFIENKFYFKD